jgi:hypothetical protein
MPRQNPVSGSRKISALTTPERGAEEKKGLLKGGREETGVLGVNSTWSLLLDVTPRNDIGENSGTSYTKARP